MNYENVKDALKELITLNDPNTTFGKVSTIIDSGVKTGERKFELKDLQESNYELLANICDLLGMSEIYLGDNQQKYFKERMDLLEAQEVAMKEEQKKSPVSEETRLSQVVSAQTNFSELAQLLRLASVQASHLDDTLRKINSFQLKADIKSR